MIYKIGEVAKLLGVSAQTLRRWEWEGFIPKVHRCPTNRREYNEEDIKKIKEELGRRYLVGEMKEGKVEDSSALTEVI